MIVSSKVVLCCMLNFSVKLPQYDMKLPQTCQSQPPSHLLAMTSLAFMLLCVPLPVCQMTRGKWSSSFPSATCEYVINTMDLPPSSAGCQVQPAGLVQSCSSVPGCTWQINCDTSQLSFDTRNRMNDDHVIATNDIIYCYTDRMTD
jgi:hypothetical protein